jgi:hypothetical protein
LGDGSLAQPDENAGRHSTFASKHNRPRRQCVRRRQFLDDFVAASGLRDAGACAPEWHAHPRKIPIAGGYTPIL